MKEVRQRIQDAIAANVLPGAVIVVTNRHGLRWEAAFGFADRELGAPSRPTIFSSSRRRPVALAATTIFMLGERGTLTFDKNMRVDCFRIVPESSATIPSN